MNGVCSTPRARSAAEAYRIPRLDGIELHHLYRAIAWLGEELADQEGRTRAPRCTKDLIEERLFAGRRDLFNDLDLVFFDTSALYFHGEGGETHLFRSAAGRTGALTENPMNRVDAYRMIQRHAGELGMRIKVGCHTFRATGITAYLEAGGTLENAQAMAAHESPRTTKLYDRTGDPR